MNVLLDTHAFIWFVDDDPRLPRSLDAIIHDPDNEIFISIVSFWEMGIKVGLGKLDLSQSLARMYEIGSQKIILDIDLPDVLLIARLEHHHRDPFDRMIIAQAFNHNLTIISKDVAFDAYGVKRLW